VEAIGLLARRGTPVTARVVGEGPQEPALRRRATELDVAVRLVGRLDDAELDRTIRGASVLALPSTREGWGLAVTEAAARGVPYVAYDIPAVREQHLVLGGGLLVPPRPTALAEGIERLLEDPSQARE